MSARDQRVITRNQSRNQTLSQGKLTEVPTTSEETLPAYTSPELPDEMTSSFLEDVHVNGLVNEAYFQVTIPGTSMTTPARNLRTIIPHSSVDIGSTGCKGGSEDGHSNDSTLDGSQDRDVSGGRNYSSRNGMLDYDFNQLYDGYERFMNPTSVNEFTVTAYRAFHCLIPSTMELTKENRCPFRSLLLSDWYFRPSVLEQPGTFDGLVRGLATQSANRFTNQFSPQVADKLFRAESPFGSDLASVDIQRNRDHGIPPYNSFRVACGRPRANNFSDFRDVMSEQDITLLSQHYEHIDDVEFYIAGLMERPAEGALTGPTFQCILGEQFLRWRNGDRFYYQFRNQSGSFTPDQFKQLEKLRLSLVFCRNGDHIQNIQPNVFQRPNTMNRVVPCSELPQLNLEAWREM